MHRRPMPLPLLALLQAASEGRRDLRLAAFDEAQVCWAVERGLGPLLLYSTASDTAATRAPSWPLLRATHLTAQILGAEQLDAMAQIIDACVGYTPLLTLLKGISICDQYYPQPQLRPMRDLDFLVERAYHPAVESILFKLGYRQQSRYPPAAFEKLHHSMPFYHPQRGVWVEVHRGLVSGHRGIAADKVFSLEHVTQQRRLSEFRGHQVYRLSDEFQIIYISAHWGSSTTIVDGMIAMLDTLYLLRNAQERLRWDVILHWLSGSISAFYFYFMLTYLRKYQLIEIAPEIPQQLLATRNPVMRLNFKILQRMVDVYVVAGKNFDPYCTSEDFNQIWRKLLLPGSPLYNQTLILRHFLRLRTRLSSLKRLWERGR